MYLRRKSKIKRTLEGCLNCGHGFLPLDNYCPQCGQIRTDGRVTVFDLIKDSFKDIFNVDSRLFKSFKYLFVPGKLTNLFFQGIQQSYFPPARLFFVVMVFHFAVLGYHIDRSINEDFHDATYSTEAKKMAEVKEEMDSSFQYILQRFDDSVVAQALDTLEKILDFHVDSIKIGAFEDGQILKLGKEIRIARIDLYNVEDSTLVNKYKLKGVNRLIVPQTIRVMKNPSYALRFMISNLLWMVIALVLLLGMVMKLLYWRRKRFYVEHVVLLFHWHAFAFFLFGIYYLITPYLHTAFVILPILATLIYFYLALLRYHQQGKFKTFVKFMILNISYLVIFNLLLVLTAVISLLVF